MQSESSPGGRRRSFIEGARRAQIVAAAAHTVAAVGYAGASLSRIATQAGISKSVISYHFAGKEDLLAQVVNDFFTATEEYMSGRLARAETAAGAIRTWVGAQIDYFAEHRTTFLAVSDIAMNYRSTDGARPFLDSAATEEAENVGQILRRGQEAGEFRDFDSTDVAVIISRSTEGVLGAWMSDERIDLMAQKQTLLDFIDHAIRKDQ